VTTDAPAASVVIPNWNGGRLLADCLASLRAQTLPAFEILVVDGASTDDSEAVARSMPGVQWVPLPRNRGFAVAANVGIARAVAPVIVLLNNDTVAEREWLAELVSGMAAAGADMAASKIRTMVRRDVLQTTGDTVDLAGRPANRGVWEEDRGQWDDRCDVFGPSGAAAAYRREVFDAVGTFYEGFESYLEDVDLAWRARLAGFTCAFVPSAVVYHHVSATGGGPYASYRVARNRVWLLARCYPTRLLVRHGGRVVAVLAGEAWRALGSARGAAARATLKGLVVGLLTWPKLLAARRRIMSGRRIDDHSLEALLRMADAP
jgi:GT2 family glycosyltransferase